MQLPRLMVLEEEEFFNVLEDPQGNYVEQMGENCHAEEQFYMSNEYELEETGEEEGVTVVLSQNSDCVVYIQSSDQEGTKEEERTTCLVNLLVRTPT